MIKKPITIPTTPKTTVIIPTLKIFSHKFIIKVIKINTKNKKYFQKQY